MNETLLLAIVLIPALVVAIVFHEVAHGLVANLLGDPTAKEQRRLSLNPIRHVDIVGTLILPGMLALSGAPVFGWAKPVPVNKWRLNNPRYGMMAVAVAGPGTNLLLAAAGAVLLGLTIPEGAQFLAADSGFPVFADAGRTTIIASTGLFYFILINSFLAVFNMLPIPPFDGSHVLEGLLPPKAARLYAKLRPYGMLLFLALIAVQWFAPHWGVLARTVGIPAFWVVDQYLALAGLFAGS